MSSKEWGLGPEGRKGGGGRGEAVLLEKTEKYLKKKERKTMN